MLKIYYLLFLRRNRYQGALFDWEWLSLISILILVHSLVKQRVTTCTRTVTTVRPIWSVRRSTWDQQRVFPVCLSGIMSMGVRPLLFSASISVEWSHTPTRSGRGNQPSQTCGWKEKSPSPLTGPCRQVLSLESSVNVWALVYLTLF